MGPGSGASRTQEKVSKELQKSINNYNFRQNFLIFNYFNENFAFFKIFRKLLYIFVAIFHKTEKNINYALGSGASEAREFSKNLIEKFMKYVMF